MHNVLVQRCKLRNPYPAAENLSDSSSTTRRLAEWAASSENLDINPVLEHLQKCLLDYIGLVSHASNNIESSAVFTSAANALSGEGTSTVLGQKLRLQPQYAALLNGTFAHSMDYDDTHIESALHPGAPVISSALAQTELEATHNQNINGRAFFEALAVGYEIMCRIGNSISSTLHEVGFHPTGVIGAYGAAAAAGRLAGLDPHQMDSLFGIMGSMASGSMQYLDNGAWNKRLHPGLAAHNALLGVQLVKAGAIGATKSIEGEFGLLKAYGHRGFDNGIQDRIGKVWEAQKTAIKPYACCRLIHGAIDALYALRRDVPPTREALIEVHISKKSLLIVGSSTPNKVNPRNIVEAQFSIFYHVAVAWLYGHNDWTAYKYLENEDVNYLSSRVRIVVDDAVPNESLQTVVSVGGKIARIIHPLGEPENPFSKEATVAKFHSMADGVYGEARASEICATVDELYNQPEVLCFIKGLAC